MNVLHLSPRIIRSTAVVAPRVVEIELADGQVLLAEVRTVDAGPADVAMLPRLRLEDAGAAFGQLATWLVDEIATRLPRPADKIGVDLGVKFALKSGKLTSVLAEASGEASATIRMEWTRQADADGAQPTGG
jgi:hypothetical protein